MSRPFDTPAAKAISPTWREALESQLAAGEQVLGALETDLDDRLRFASGCLVLTDRQLLFVSGGEHRAARGASQWHTWQLEGSPELRLADHGSIGKLELIGPSGRIAHWTFTVARHAAAQQFKKRFDERRRGGPVSRAEVNGEHEPARKCPSCGATLPPDAIDCPECSLEAAPPPTRSLMRLLRFGRPYVGLIAAGFLLTLAGTAAGLVPPYLTMPLTDNVLIPLQEQHATGIDRGVRVSQVWWYLAGFLGAIIVSWSLSWARKYVMARVSELLSADIRNRTYAHLMKLSLEYFGGKRTGDLISRVGSDTDRICTFLSVNMVDFSTDVLMIVMTSVIMLWINPGLALLVLVPFPFIAWMMQLVRVRLRHGFGRGYNAWGQMLNVLADTIPGARVVKAFAQERREVERFARANQHVVDVNNRVNRLWSLFDPTITLLTDSGVLVVWLCGAAMIASGQITVGTLTAFLAYIARFYVRLESMSRMLTATQRAGAATHRIFEILDRVPSVPDPVRPVHPGRVQGQIEFRGVAFKYGTRSVLRGIDLAIAPGEMIGLVGPSGAGKSTVVNLLCRFYDVGSGAILVDGTDIRSFPVDEYRANIGIVLQDPFLFYGTIAENIAYGRPEAKREEIVAAARAAHAHEFILKLADGYDSLVGERGQALSGGERQRISIARAILIDPRILILDEATSSVDTETEREIQAALDNLIQGRTTIAIAHRLSTLRKADRLVVLDQGQICQIGTHDALLQQAGVYARFHQAQLQMAQAM
jgi:ATP-binding cassette subfamily B protein